MGTVIEYRATAKDAPWEKLAEIVACAQEQAKVGRKMGLLAVYRAARAYQQESRQALREMDPPRVA